MAKRSGKQRQGQAQSQRQGQAQAQPGATLTPDPGLASGAGVPGKLTPEEIAARKAKRLANRKTQMPYQNLLADVTVRSGQPQAVVNAVVGALKVSIGKGLLSDNVVMLGPDLGSFKVMTTEPRKARNPRTGESIDVPAGKRVKFQVGSALKTLLLTGSVPEKPTRKKPEPGVEARAGAVGGAAVGEPAIGGKSERARKIAARRAQKAAEGVVEVGAGGGAVPVTPGAVEPASQAEGSVSDKDIDDILNESLGEEGGEQDLF